MKFLPFLWYRAIAMDDELLVAFSKPTREIHLFRCLKLLLLPQTSSCVDKLIGFVVRSSYDDGLHRIFYSLKKFAAHTTLLGTTLLIGRDGGGINEYWSPILHNGATAKLLSLVVIETDRNNGNVETVLLQCRVGNQSHANLEWKEVGTIVRASFWKDSDGATASQLVQHFSKHNLVINLHKNVKSNRFLWKMKVWSIGCLHLKQRIAFNAQHLQSNRGTQKANLVAWLDLRRKDCVCARDGNRRFASIRRHDDSAGSLDAVILGTLDGHRIQRPRDIANDATLPACLGHEVGYFGLTRGQHHNAIHKLIGVVADKDDWAIGRYVVTTHNIDSSKEYGDNRVKEDLDGEVEESLHLRYEDVRHEGNRDCCNVPWGYSGEDMKKDLDRVDAIHREDENSSKDCKLSLGEINVRNHLMTPGLRSHS
mmetsp:Transcript_10773/g.17852  ORF Transcript_10773/g.17852 Transcript_10773/m.17852 type:complete len:424 (-) Transcript_10773:220-1491(-)